MAIDKLGISTGREVRLLLDLMETGLLINFKNFFKEKQDKSLSEVDLAKWKQKKMQQLPQFKKTNKSIVKSYIPPLKKAIREEIKQSYSFGINYVDKQIKQAQKKGKTIQKIGTAAAFSKNPRVREEVKKMQANINRSFNNALRDMDNKFLETIAQVQRKQGRSLYEAIDNSTKTLMFSGITAGYSADGKRLGLVSKLETDAKEHSQEIMFMGEGEQANAYNQHLVIITIHASSCPLCTPWQNKVLIDDVYQDGKPDGKHQLLSVAIKQGLFHYNCRHNRLTFIDGIDKVPDKPHYVPERTREQHMLYQKEQQQRYMERKIREWKRRETGALSDQEYRKARLKVRQWQSRRLHLVKDTKGLYRSHYWREKPGFRLARDKRWQDLRYNKDMVRR